jgi:DNA-directed RNA polymerase specialized sigma24 family protein
LRRDLVTSIPFTPSTPSAGVPRPKDRDHDARFGREVLPLAAEVYRLALALCGLGPSAERLVASTLRRAYALSLGACPRQAGVLGTPAAEQSRRLLALCRELFEQSGDSYGAASGVGPARDVAALDPARDILGSGRVFATTLREQLAEPWPATSDLDASMMKVPPECRAALVLVDVSGTPSRMAAEILGIDETELRARLFRGRRLLQERLLEARLTGPEAKHES